MHPGNHMLPGGLIVYLSPQILNTPAESVELANKTMNVLKSSGNKTIKQSSNWLFKNAALRNQVFIKTVIYISYT